MVMKHHKPGPSYSWPAQWVFKQPAWKVACRIGGVWALAIGILVGGLYTVQGHIGIGAAQKAADCGGYWVVATHAVENKPWHINLSLATSVIEGTFNDKPATLIWSGDAIPVKETPAELFALPPVKMGGK